MRTPGFERSTEIKSKYPSTAGLPRIFKSNNNKIVVTSERAIPFIMNLANRTDLPVDVTEDYDVLAATYFVAELYWLTKNSTNANFQKYMRQFAEYLAVTYTGANLSAGALALMRQNELERSRQTLDREKLQLERQRLALESEEAAARKAAAEGADSARKAAASARARDELLVEIERVIYCSGVYNSVRGLNRQRVLDVVNTYLSTMSTSGFVVRANGAASYLKFGSDAKAQLMNELLTDTSKTCPPFVRRKYEERIGDLVESDQRLVNSRIDTWLNVNIPPAPGTVSEFLRVYAPEVYTCLDAYMTKVQKMCDLRPNVTMEELLTHDPLYVRFVVCAVNLRRTGAAPATQTRYQISTQVHVNQNANHDLRVELHKQGWRSAVAERELKKRYRVEYD